MGFWLPKHKIVLGSKQKGLLGWVFQWTYSPQHTCVQYLLLVIVYWSIAPLWYSVALPRNIICSLVYYYYIPVFRWRCCVFIIGFYAWEVIALSFRFFHTGRYSFGLALKGQRIKAEMSVETIISWGVWGSIWPHCDSCFTFWGQKCSFDNYRKIFFFPSRNLNPNHQVHSSIYDQCCQFIDFKDLDW